MGERGTSGMETQMRRSGENGGWMDGWGCNGLRVLDYARNAEKGKDGRDGRDDRDRK